MYTFRMVGAQFEESQLSGLAIDCEKGGVRTSVLLKDPKMPVLIESHLSSVPFEP